MSSRRIGSLVLNCAECLSLSASRTSVRVKHRVWGPYVWWICPSHKCNFENKTDLVFLKTEFQTKCQYCNTPVTLKRVQGQLIIESAGPLEEEKPTSPPAPRPAAPTLPQASQTLPTSPAPTPSKTATPPPTSQDTGKGAAVPAVTKPDSPEPSRAKESEEKSS